ncbi:putative membrane protein [Escherichia coli 2-052-05_S4_C2]|nr:putative membrane protein [Escherichia coli 2-052-05_S4_C2]
MTLSGQMHNSIWLMIGKYLLHLCAIADICALKFIARIFFYIFK